MRLNLKRKGKEYIAKIETLIRKVANTTKDQSTEDKEDSQVCRTCKKDKPLNQYYKRANKKHEIHCRSCRNKQRDRNHRHWKQEFIYKLANHVKLECVICGYNKSFSALDFHHVNKKNFSIARITRNLSHKNFTDGKVDKIIHEIIFNCEILCANCHREEHTKHIMKMIK